MKTRPTDRYKNVGKVGLEGVDTVVETRAKTTDLLQVTHQLDYCDYRRFLSLLGSLRALFTSNSRNSLAHNVHDDSIAAISKLCVFTRRVKI